MKTLFTVHGGEYLVGSHIEERFKRVNCGFLLVIQA